ncbi:MAG: thioredoxin-disulfide reductase [Bacillota bacterium]|nr:thioredoxin-disulfide reductase [Candidatus Fermentithermobacillaceae bacterium]
MVQDVIIAGGGPAGLTASIYTARAGLKVKIVDPVGAGGQAGTTSIIHNYPGFPDGVSGPELMGFMSEQAKAFGAEIEYGEVSALRKENSLFLVTIDGKDYEARSVIWAAGTSPRSLGVPGEADLIGRGVSFCAICDGPLFRDKVVAVVGGGDSALTGAQFLTGYAKEVILIHRRDQFRASLANVNRVVGHPRITLKLNSTVHQMKGDGLLESLVVRNVETGSIGEIEVDAVFLYVGSIPNSAPLEGLADLTSSGYVKTREDMSTGTPGLFAVGDVRDKLLRQVATAVGDGAVAGWSAEKYIIENFR